MKIKMVGLGKMGMNLALNMKDHNVEAQGFDVRMPAKKQKKMESRHLKHWRR